MARVAQVKVLMSEAELSELRRLAGDVPLSTFCRKLIFAKITLPAESDQPKITKETVRHIAKNFNLENMKPKYACPHGTPKGNHCWQCGGSAKWQA